MILNQSKLSVDNLFCKNMPETQLKSQLEEGINSLLFCGFGVGLSWGTCYLETDNLKVLDLIEL